MERFPRHLPARAESRWGNPSMVLEMEGGQSRIQGRANGGSGLHEQVQKYKRAMYLRPRWNQVTRTESRVAYPSYASVASEAGARLDSSLRIPPCMGLCRTRRRKCLPLARFLRGCKVYEVTLGITTTTCDKRPKEATRHRLHSHADGVTDSPSRGRRQPDRVAGREESLLARPCAWGGPHTVGGHGRCQAHRCRCQTRRVPLSDGGS